MAAKLIVLVAFVAVANAHRFIRPMENPDLFQGDIIGDYPPQDRNAVTAKASRWPNGVIPYTYDLGMLFFLPKIKQAMKHIEAHTCIRFERYDGTQRGYVRFFSGQGCYSHWGRTGGQQPISLGGECGHVGIIIHELLHAVGFAHEQNRSDRDDYLIIYYENIMQGVEDQFVKFRPNENWLINAFDYGSIMIYGDTAGSKDGYSKTMVAKKPGAKFYNPDEKTSMSPSDIERVRILYECKKRMA